MKRSLFEYRAEEELTFVLEPFLRPVLCGIAQREFVYDVGKDLRAQCALNLQHCFPVMKIEISQSSVVSANGLGDGEGGRGHRRSEGVPGPGDWLGARSPRNIFLYDRS